MLNQVRKPLIARQKCQNLLLVEGAPTLVKILTNKQWAEVKPETNFRLIIDAADSYILENAKKEIPQVVKRLMDRIPMSKRRNVTPEDCCNVWFTSEIMSKFMEFVQVRIMVKKSPELR